jgi:hypothetical protein
MNWCHIIINNKIIVIIVRSLAAQALVVSFTPPSELITVMAIYYFNSDGIGQKQIDFESTADVISASCMAYLDYGSMAACNKTSKVCHSYLYVALTGFREYELSPELCNNCGWGTGIKHVGLTCDLRYHCMNSRNNLPFRLTNQVALFCCKCVKVYGADILCLKCISKSDWLSREGYHERTPLVVKAWLWSCMMQDAINKWGDWTPRDEYPFHTSTPPYPYSITDTSDDGWLHIEFY